MEAEAVRLILANCQTGEWQMLVSEAIDSELKRTPDIDRKREVKLWTASVIIKISLTEQVKSRARELNELGFKNYDALHIACAEVGNADILLTTDDRMLRLAARCRNLLQVRVENPLDWVMEVTDDRRD
ncbi:MAG: PIN domain-containing protein [Nostoc sp.]|uniref:PIN domain-containing protein n=1 Tax=Nostoc sp. TaxID=1180 RepID=UPI002FF8E331